MPRLPLWLFAVTLVVFTCLTHTAAYEPPALSDYIPWEANEFLSKEDIEALENGEVPKSLGQSGMFDFLKRVLLTGVDETVNRLSGLLVLVIASSMAAALKNTVSSDGMSSGVYEFASALCIAAAAYGIVNGLFDMTGNCIDKLSSFVNTMLPVMNTVYISGGSAATAAVTNAGLLFLLTLTANFFSLCLLPATKICFGFSLVGALQKTTDLSGISQLVRNTLTGALVFVMTLCAVILSYQTKLAQSAEGVASRMIKFAASSFVPIVGGAVGEASKTLIGSFTYIKSSLGIVSIAAVLYMTVPTLVTLFAYKTGIGLVAAGAKTLGCEREGALLCDIGKLLNMAVGITVSCCTVFIFAFTLFTKTVLAIGM